MLLLVKEQLLTEDKFLIVSVVSFKVFGHKIPIMTTIESLKIPFIEYSILSFTPIRGIFNGCAQSLFPITSVSLKVPAFFGENLIARFFSEPGSNTNEPPFITTKEELVPDFSFVAVTFDASLPVFVILTVIDVSVLQKILPKSAEFMELVSWL